VIQAEGICKNYDPKQVLRGVDFVAYPNETIALMGPNGAGKTTLLNILSTLLAPDAGRLSYFGHSLKGNESEIRRRMGMVGHQGMLYSELTIEENLRFYAALYAVLQPKMRIDQILDLVELKKQRQQVVRTLSRGMQQRLSIGRSLLHDPQILFLDEPFTGLDQNLSGRMLKLIQQLAGQNKTVLITSHRLDEVFALAKRVIILHRGMIVDQFELIGMQEADLAQRYQAATAAIAVSQ
jgi:ABC-type multidrug transport system ATPase subunit